MTETEWLTGDDTKAMLVYLTGKVSRRKTLLTLIACCRRFWHSMPDARSRRAIEVAERRADGVATAEELETAYADAGIAAQELYAKHFGEFPVRRSFYGGCVGSAQDAALLVEPGHEDAPWRQIGFIGWIATDAYPLETLEELERREARRAEMVAASPGGLPLSQVAEFLFGGEEATARDRLARTAIQAEERAQAAILRELFGNPFRPSPPLPASVLAWNEGTVRRLAEGIYEERAFDRLPILADALEEAGYDDEPVLGHCRSAGSHFRGCWAVDLVLARS
jgi:hypothetical protein